MSSKTERQLRELRRLMPWTWDARVEKHPPGEKALKDFENVLSHQEQSRTRKVVSITTKTGPGSSSVNNGSTGGQGESASHNKRPQSAGQQHSSEQPRSGKRASPGQPSLEDKAGRDCKAARPDADPSATVVAMRSHSALEGPDVEATPAAHRRRPASPAAPTSGATGATPATAARTPATGLMSSAPLSVLASCPHQAALTGAQCKPTPATAIAQHTYTAAKPSSTGDGAGEGEHYPLRRQLLQSTNKPLARHSEQRGGEEGGGFRSPEPGSVLSKPAAVTAACVAAPALLADEGPFATDMDIDVDAARDAPTSRPTAASRGVGAPAARSGPPPIPSLHAPKTEEAQMGARLVEVAADGMLQQGWQEDMCGIEADGGWHEVNRAQPHPASAATLQHEQQQCGGAQGGSLLLDCANMAPVLTPAAPALQDQPPAKLAEQHAMEPAAAEGTGGTATVAAEGGLGPQPGFVGARQLVLAGLEAVTPAPGGLPSPPALDTWRQQGKGLGPMPGERSAPQGTPSCDSATADAAAGSQVLLTPLVPQPQPLKRALAHVAAAPVGASKPPFYMANASSTPEGPNPSLAVHAPGAMLVARQCKVLTALSRLPPGNVCAPEAPPAAPAVPLFQKGSASTRPGAITSDTRPSGDAALQSLLMALPEAAPTTVLGSVGGGACPPLFKLASGSSSRSSGKEVQGASVPRQQQKAAAGEDVVMEEVQAAPSPPKPSTHQLKGMPTLNMVDKENRCSNATPAAAAPLMSPMPPPPPRPSAAERRPPSSHASPGERLSSPGTGALQRGQARAPGKAAGRVVSPPAVAAAAAPTAAQRRVVLSSRKVHQLATLNRSQHARERQLLRAVPAGGMVSTTSRPAKAGVGVAGPFPHAPAMQAHHHSRRGSAAAPGASGARAEGRQGTVGRAGRAAAGHSPSTAGEVGSRRGRELVIGPALARACTLLLKARLSEFAAPATAPCVH